MYLTTTVSSNYRCKCTWKFSDVKEIVDVFLISVIFSPVAKWIPLLFLFFQSCKQSKSKWITFFHKTDSVCKEAMRSSYQCIFFIKKKYILTNKETYFMLVTVIVIHICNCSLKNRIFHYLNYSIIFSLYLYG